jgi:hypothetical protein
MMIKMMKTMTKTSMTMMMTTMLNQWKKNKKNTYFFNQAGHPLYTLLRKLDLLGHFLGHNHIPTCIKKKSMLPIKNSQR